MKSPLSSRQQIQFDLRKRWLYVVPCVFITYSLAYVDRANYGLGAAAGLARTLHIGNSKTALLGALFFLGYFLFQVPGATYARRKSAVQLVFYALIGWGTFAALTGVLRNFWLLALDRFLLGVAESFVFPALLILLTHWFTQAERSRANTLLFLGNPVSILWMSAVTGYLIAAVGWQKAFIYEGLPSIAWAFFWLLLMRDRPQTAPWMGQRAREELAHQLQREQRAISGAPDFRSALKNGNVRLLCAQYFLWSVSVYGFVLWLPTIVKLGSFSSIQTTGLLCAVPYLLAISMMLPVSHYSDKLQERRSFLWPSLTLSGVALLVSCIVVPHSFWIAYAFLVLAGGAMYAPYGVFFAIIPEILPITVAGEVMALINSTGALGAFFGAWLVGQLGASTGNSRAGLLLMAICLLLSGLMMLGLRDDRRSAKIIDKSLQPR